MIMPMIMQGFSIALGIFFICLFFGLVWRCVMAVRTGAWRNVTRAARPGEFWILTIVVIVAMPITAILAFNLLRGLFGSVGHP